MSSHFLKNNFAMFKNSTKNKIKKEFYNMSYSEKIEESKKKVYNHAIATKILDLMDKLRMDATDTSERRWIWELLQNAKDVGYEESGVEVEIDFSTINNSGNLKFSHNGRPFSVDNITFLIEQVSTKERNVTEGEKPKTTGKFGTGFLTTHLLSEIVEVKGIIKEPEYPFKTFELLLDRSGREIKNIIESVHKSLSLLSNLDSQPAIDNFNSNGQNTSFKYTLTDKGINVAEIGLKDFHYSIPYVLAFNPKVKSVKVLNEDATYKLSKNEVISDTFHSKISHRA